MKTLLKNEQTEFQKFLLFNEKAKELAALKEKWYLLLRHSEMHTEDMQKAVRTSSKRWESYMSGKEMLPDGYLKGFEKRLEIELDDAWQKKTQKQLDWYLKDNRSLMNLVREANQSTPEGTEGTPISSSLAVVK